MTCFRLNNGKTVRSWCKENGICYQTIWHRLDAGFTPEEACSKKYKNKNRKLFYKERSIVDICGGTSTKRYRRIWSRLKRGWTMEQAVKERVKHGH